MSFVPTIEYGELPEPDPISRIHTFSQLNPNTFKLFIKSIIYKRIVCYLVSVMIETLSKTMLASSRKALVLTVVVAMLALAAVDPVAAECSHYGNLPTWPICE